MLQDNFNLKRPLFVLLMDLVLDCVKKLYLLSQQNPFVKTFDSTLSLIFSKVDFSNTSSMGKNIATKVFIQLN